MFEKPMGYKMKTKIALCLIIIGMMISKSVKSQNNVWFTLFHEDFIGGKVHYPKYLRFVDTLEVADTFIGRHSYVSFKNEGYVMIYEKLPKNFVYNKSLIKINIQTKPGTSIMRTDLIRAGTPTLRIENYVNDSSWYIGEFTNKADSTQIIAYDNGKGTAIIYQIQMDYYGYFQDTTSHTAIKTVIPETALLTYSNNTVYNKGNEPVSIKMIDLEGRTVLEDEVSAYAVKKVPVTPGIYFLYMKREEQISYKKIVVEY